MPRSRTLLASLAVLAVAACNPFRGEPAVQVGSADPMLHTRWHAHIASPASLAGAVQMQGTATMGSTADGAGTIVTIDLANAAPGGEHPWEVRSGRCGATSGAVFGSSDAYERLEVASDGHAEASATIPQRTPERGDHSVIIYASETNRSMVVACGNFAPPTR